MLPSNVARYEGEVMLDGRNLLTLADAELRGKFAGKNRTGAAGCHDSSTRVIRVGEPSSTSDVDGAIDSRTARSRAHELLERVAPAISTIAIPTN